MELAERKLAIKVERNDRFISGPGSARHGWTLNSEVAGHQRGARNDPLPSTPNGAASASRSQCRRLSGSQQHRPVRFEGRKHTTAYQAARLYPEKPAQFARESGPGQSLVALCAGCYKSGLLGGSFCRFCEDVARRFRQKNRNRDAFPDSINWAAVVTVRLPAMT